MSTGGRDERTLREAITSRAVELGARVRPDDLRLQYADVPGAPAYRLVRATWGAGASADGLGGLLHDGAEPDLLPAHAVGRLLADWRGSATEAVVAVAFLLDPMARWEPLHTVADTAGWRSADGPVGPPELLDDPASDVAARLSFWWRRDAVARQVVVDLDASGRATIGGGRTAVQDAQGVDGGRP